jgi:hypothetical protein
MSIRNYADYAYVYFGFFISTFNKIVFIFKCTAWSTVLPCNNCQKRDIYSNVGRILCSLKTDGLLQCCQPLRHYGVHLAASTLLQHWEQTHSLGDGLSWYALQAQLLYLRSHTPWKLTFWPRIIIWRQIKKLRHYTVNRKSLSFEI